MYESLKEFSNIIVSGPQRSGTRIVAKIISADTGKTYIDEKDINFEDFRLLQWYIAKGNCVVQCPAMSRFLHHIKDPSTLIIMVRRNIDDIVNSEAVDWNDHSRNQELFKYGRSNGIISQIKYDFWYEVQQPILGDRGRIIIYENLKDHPLFIQDRTGFRWDQTK